MRLRSLLASTAMLAVLTGGAAADPLSLTFPQAAPVATSAPLSLLPNLPAPPVASRQKAPRPVAAAVVPLPRVRPPVAVNGAAAETPPSVDTAFTGSIAEAQPEPATPAAIAAAPSPARAPQMASAVESDGLLGSPSSFDLGPRRDLAPNAPQPSPIAAPLRGAGLAATGEAAGARPPAEPFSLVRSLQALQDRMATGDVAAVEGQRTLRVAIDRALASAAPAVWQDRRNVEAAVTYVLSGGSPQILKTLLALDPKPSIDARLVDGVLQYATGNVAAAGGLLEVDAVSVPASMAGQVAIAQSALVVQQDPVRAMQLLSLARLLAPGTLVEEAAIRRQLFVADQQRDDATIETLARQYLDRFRHSVYAGNFRARFAAALSHMRTLNSEATFTRLDDMLAMVEPDARCELYLTVALASTIGDRLTAARLAAERASSLALAGSVEEARARLYHAAALAALPGMVDKGHADLEGLNPALLSSADHALLDVVTATVEGVRSGTDRAAIKVAAAEPLGEGGAGDDMPSIKRARQALADSETLVAKK